MADDFISYDSLAGGSPDEPAKDEGFVSYDDLAQGQKPPAIADKGGFFRLPRDVAEAGARGINAAAQAVSGVLPESLQATPRKPEPYSWEKTVDDPVPWSAIGHGVVEEAKKIAKPIGEAVSLPGDVYAGKTDPLSDEGIERATNLAGLTAMPLRSKTAGGTSKAIAQIEEGPSVQQLKAAAGAGYQHPIVKEVKVATEASNLLSKEIQNNLTSVAGVDAMGAPRTFKVLHGIENAPPESFMTVDNLRSVRRTLNNIAKDSLMPDKGTEKMAALSALGHVDEFLSNLQAKDIIAGNPAHAAALIKQANANYAAAMRSAMLDTKMVKAQLRAKAANSGMNIGNTVRQRMADILLTPKLRLGFSPKELEMMQTLVEGTTTSNAMRTAGNIAGGGGGLGTAAWEVGAAVSGHHPMAAVPLAGWALRKLSNRSAVNQAKNISKTVRKRSPLAEGKTVNPADYNQGGSVYSPAKEYARRGGFYRRGGLVNHYDEGGGRGNAPLTESPPPPEGLGPPPSPGVDIPPGFSEAIARGEKTWTAPDASFWAMTTVDEPLENPHQAPVHWGSDAGDAYLMNESHFADLARNEQIAAQEMRAQAAQAQAPGARSAGIGGGAPGGGDFQIMQAAARPKQEADWAQFEQGLERPDSLSWGAGNPVMSNGQKQFYPVWGPAGMRVIDRIRRQGKWQPDPGEEYYSATGYHSGKSLGYETAFTLPGWSGGYQMVGYPGDIQGWIPVGGSGVKRGGLVR